jgi:hypothetical protein
MCLLLLPLLLLLLLLLQNNWTAAVTQPTPHGFLWTPSPAPAHSVAAVGMLGLAFAAAEQQAGRATLVRNMECWCLQQVGIVSYSLPGGLTPCGLPGVKPDD